jgi:hypothetical protein
MPEAVGVVHVFIAAEPPECGLTEQTDHPVLPVLPGPWVNKTVSSYLGQSEGLVEFPERQKPRIERDLRSVEFQLQPTVEVQPQCPGFTFTHRVSHPQPLQSAGNALILIPESCRHVAKSLAYLGNRGLV